MSDKTMQYQGSLIDPYIVACTKLCYNPVMLPVSKSCVCLFGMPGPGEWLVILLVILLFVGPKKLPELMRSLGKSVNSFKKGMKESDDTGDTDKDSSKNNSATPSS